MFTELTKTLGTSLRAALSDLTEVNEIRIRANAPLSIKKHGKEYYVRLSGEHTADKKLAYHPSPLDISQTIDIMSRFSLYAYEDELRNGFLTLEGGHRAGICGRAVMSKDGIRTIKDFSSIHLRVAHEIPYCANPVLPHMTDPLRSCLIISPPGCGKTTLLRDLIRQVSNSRVNVSLVDERSEIAGCVAGQPQNDVGSHTDILDACPKSEGMRILLRAMSPQVIAVDEIGKTLDIEAIEDAANSGVRVFATAHGNGLEALKNRPALNTMFHKALFERYVVLTPPWDIENVYDAELRGLL